MGNLLINLGELHSAFKKKVADEERKPDGYLVSMKNVVISMVKIYIENDELNYHNLSKDFLKVENKKGNVSNTNSVDTTLEKNEVKTIEDKEIEKTEAGPRVRVNRSFNNISR